MQRRQDAAIDRAVTGQGLRIDVVLAVDAHHLFDEVGLAVDVGTPGRHRDRHGLAAARDAEAETLENVGRFLGADGDADKPANLGERELDDLRLVAGIADDVAAVEGLPPHRSRTSCVACSIPPAMNSGSTPRSKR